MRANIQILGVATLLSLFSLDSISAEEAKQWTQCREHQSLGLFEQCSSIRIIQSTGSIVRAYSHSNRELLTVSNKNVFQFRPVSIDDSLKLGENVLIPGNRVWSRSSEDVQMLCRYQGQNENHLSLDCGQDDAVKVHRSNVLKVVQTFQELSEMKEQERLQKMNASANH